MPWRTAARSEARVLRISRSALAPEYSATRWTRPLRGIRHEDRSCGAERDGRKAPVCRIETPFDRDTGTRWTGTRRGTCQDRRRGTLPFRSVGHQRRSPAADTVEALGAGVTDLEKGDHVVMVFVPSCGHCLPCAEGRPALCEPGALANTAGTLLSGARRLSRDGQRVHHHLGCSAFAHFATVSRRSLVKIDRELPLDEAALFGCAVLTGVGAVVNTARVAAGQSVAIVGLGGVGLAALIGAVSAGASRIVAIDVADDKLTLAKTLGATDAFSARSADCVPDVKAATAG